MAKQEFQTVEELIKNIQENRTQTSANAKDEVRVAQAMLNDPSYKVDIYSKKGIQGQYCPYEDVRAMCSSVIKDTTKISQAEADGLIKDYQFDRAEAQSMVNFSKEFINTYIQTGRKLPLGGRERSNVQLAIKTKEAKIASFPAATSVDSDGNKVYSTSQGKFVPEHDTIKVYSSCPAWLQNRGVKPSGLFFV